MKIKAVLIPLSFVMLSMVSPISHSAYFFEDSFESGDMSSTNSSGFKWSASASTSVVNETHETYTNSSPTNTPISNAAGFPGGDWTAKGGSHSMRFRYPAGANQSERRFTLGAPQKDVWIRYWIRVPTNYNHASGRSPNKFLAVWSDGYSSKGDGSTVWLSLQRSGDGNSSIWFSNSAGGNQTSQGSQQTTPFITTSDAGRWMQIILHAKAESSPGASDGVVQTFRRWEGESSFTTLHNASNLNIALPSSGSSNGFNRGYILGYANAPYTEDTEWLVDDFTVSDAPLVVTPKPISMFSVE